MTMLQKYFQPGEDNAMTTVSRVKAKNNKIENFNLANFFFDNEKITVSFVYTFVVVVQPETFRILVQVTIELLSH